MAGEPAFRRYFLLAGSWKTAFASKAWSVRVYVSVTTFAGASSRPGKFALSVPFWMIESTMSAVMFPYGPPVSSGIALLASSTSPCAEPAEVT